MRRWLVPMLLAWSAARTTAVAAGASATSPAREGIASIPPQLHARLRHAGGDYFASSYRYSTNDMTAPS
jgi:hypothetical protein